MVVREIFKPVVEATVTTLLLASKSPRRRQLLGQLGYEVRVVELEVEERLEGAVAADEVAERLALIKSEGYKAPLHPGEVLVTADTVVVLGQEVLGKPQDAADAYRMLRALSGVEHQVYTGVCLRSNVGTVHFSDRTAVHFRNMSDAVIQTYIDQGTCFDKAGAYGIQEWIGMVGVERIEGCYYNVMGLPLSRLYYELQELIRKS